VLLLVLLGVSRLSGAVELDLAPDTRAYGLAPFVGVYVDHDKNLSISEVLKPEGEQLFVPNTNRNMNYGFATSAYWFRLVIRNDAAVQGPWLLQVQHPTLDRVEFYLVEDGQLRAQRTTGDAFSFTTRDLPHGDFVFRLPEPLSKEVTVYLRIESEGSVIAPLMLWRADQFIVDQDINKQVLGVYFGIILAIILYNLFLFVSIRESTYAYYVLYLTCMLLLQTVLEGIAAQYFWPAAPKWNNYSIVIFLGAVNIFGLLFARTFLDLKKTLPAMSRLLVFLGLVMLMIMVLGSLLSYHHVILAAIGQSVVISVAILCVAVYLLKTGNRQVRFMLLAYGALFPGIVLLILGNLNLIEAGALSKQALKIGTALDAILLSFGLADRIKTLAGERESARRDADEQREKALILQRDFARKLLDSQEQERRRIAGELHDGIGQNLLVIVNQMRRFIDRNKADVSDLAQAADLAAQSVEETREIAYALHPHILDRLGLTKAIEAVVKRGLKDQPLEGSVTIDNIDGILPKSHEIHLYRIVQEGISNIVKHAKASHCWISIQLTDNGISINIEDDGVGTPDDMLRGGSKSGMGISGLKERSMMIGGSFSIGPRAAGGTIIKIRIATDRHDTTASTRR